MSSSNKLAHLAARMDALYEFDREPVAASELPELMGIADRIVMLTNGRIGGTFSCAEATQERLLAAAMGHT